MDVVAATTAFADKEILGILNEMLFGVIMVSPFD